MSPHQFSYSNFLDAGMLLNSGEVQSALLEITAVVGDSTAPTDAGNPVMPAAEEEARAAPKAWQCIQTLDPLGATDATAGNFVSTIEFDQTGHAFNAGLG